MNETTLVIGNKNYSSWSLRPWLLMRHFDINFRELRIPLDSEQFRAEIGKWSPSRRVPVLHDGDTVVWDSLAICEYVNERWLGGRGWPKAPAARAHARSLVAEMHSGYAALRQQLPMNIRRPVGAIEVDASAATDIATIQARWSDCLGRHGGPYLYGDFTIADAYYAPVVWRLHTYAVEVDEQVRRYLESMLAHPQMMGWRDDALIETEWVEADELPVQPPSAPQ